MQNDHQGGGHKGSGENPGEGNSGSGSGSGSGSASGSGSGSGPSEENPIESLVKVVRDSFDYSSSFISSYLHIQLLFHSVLLHKSVRWPHLKSGIIKANNLRGKDEACWRIGEGAS